MSKTKRPVVPSAKSYEGRLERERIVQRLIDEGLTQSDIARELGITPQSVNKFLRTRGWKTKPELEREARLERELERELEEDDVLG